MAHLKQRRKRKGESEKGTKKKGKRWRRLDQPKEFKLFFFCALSLSPLLRPLFSLSLLRSHFFISLSAANTKSPFLSDLSSAWQASPLQANKGGRWADHKKTRNTFTCTWKPGNSATNSILSRLTIASHGRTPRDRVIVHRFVRSYMACMSACHVCMEKPHGITQKVRRLIRGVVQENYANAFAPPLLFLFPRMLVFWEFLPSFTKTTPATRPWAPQYRNP